MVKRALVAAAAASFLGGCDQFTSLKGTPVAPLASQPIVIMHRGGGQGNPDYRENTLPAIVYGAGVYDGAEMDLQLSQGGTLWLGHDNDVHDCSDPAGGPTGGAVVDCFQNLGDAEIETYAYCDTATAAPCTDRLASTCEQHYVRLEDVFERFSTDPTLLQKLLSLDVKDQLCGRTGGIPESQTMANALHGLVTKYQMDWRLLVQSDQRTFVSQFHDNGTQTFLFIEGYGDVDPIIEDAAKQGATGISYPYRNAPLDPTFAPGLRQVGLHVMVWTVPDPRDAVADIPLVWAMSPDVIETDRPDFFLYVPRLP